MDNREIKFTICFCIQDGNILMIYRNFPPNQHLWNGLGGKLERGEHPTESVKRETREEADIDLNLADDVKFRGIVSWDSYNKEEEKHNGMYAYIATFSQHSVFFPKRDTREGVLEWKPLAFVTDPANTVIPTNVPKFFSQMLHANMLYDYRYTYRNNDLVDFQIFPLEEGTFAL